MSEKAERSRCEFGPGESFGQMVATFGQAISEIFNDPELKTRAREFGDAASASARTMGGRFKDEEVREKLRQAGEAAEQFGRSVADYFESESNTTE